MSPYCLLLNQIIIHSNVPDRSNTSVTAKGDIVYSEVVCENVQRVEAYVEEMASGDTASDVVNIQQVQDDVLKLWTVVKSQLGIGQEQKNRIKALYEGVVRSLRKGPDTRPSAPQHSKLKVGGTPSSWSGVDDVFRSYSSPSPMDG